jgi:hypothetical protein
MAYPIRQMTDPYNGSQGLSKRNVYRIFPERPFMPAIDTAAGEVVSPTEVCYVEFFNRYGPGNNSDGQPH